MKKNFGLKAICVMTIGLSLSLSISAQTVKFETATSFGSSAPDEAHFAITDKDGNYYIVGFGGGDMVFPGGLTLSGKGATDGIIVKYDSDMNVVWARYVGGTGKDVFESLTILSNGDVVVVGQIEGEVSIDGTNEKLTTVNAIDGCIVVYDQNGTYKKSTLIYGAGNTNCNSVISDKADNIFVTGSAIGLTTFNNGKNITLTGAETNMFLAQYNRELQTQWVIGGNSKKDETVSTPSYGWSLALDKEENILMSGRFGNTITITGTDNLPVSKSIGDFTSIDDGFIAKITHSGACQWITYVTNAAKRIDARSIAADSNGNIFLFGHSNAAVTVEGQTPYNFAGNFDNFLVKFDKDGKYIDGFSNGGPGRDEGKNIFVDSKDFIYIAGNMNGTAKGSTINMNPKGLADVNITCYGHDGYFAKYDGTTLSLIQVEKTTSPKNATPHEVAFNVTMNKENNRIYTTGYFNNGNTIFDGENGTITLPCIGQYDIYTTIYSSLFILKTKTLPDGVVNTPYYTAILVDNAQGSVSYSLKKGDLPIGLCINEGALAGIPTVAGKYIFTISISDGVSTVDKEYVVNIASGEGCDIFINTDVCPFAYKNTAYSFQLNISGNVSSCMLTGGKLPVGLTVSSTGLISGTPASSNAEGIYTFKVKAEGATCFDELDLNILLKGSVGINEIIGVTSFSIYPTITSGDLFLNIELQKEQKIDVQIFNVLGLSYYTKRYYTNNVNDCISTAGFSAGTYIVVVSTADGVISNRIIVK